MLDTNSILLMGFVNDRSENMISELVENNVVNSNGEKFRLTEQFQTQLERNQDRLDKMAEKEKKSAINIGTESGENIDLIWDIGETDSEFIPLYVTLSDFLKGETELNCLRVIPLLYQLNHQNLRTHGAPDSFMSIQGDKLGTITSIFSRSIVYIWKEDCDPCDSVKETFNNILENSPQGIALFAIYGPDHPKYLNENYDIKGGPVTLFMERNVVDSRVYGARHRRVYENEIEELRSTTTPNNQQ